MAILEEVFRSALRRKYGDDENFDIIINPDKGDLEIWRNRIVVEDDKVEDDNLEIAISEARKIEPDFEVGEDVSEEVKLIDLGRRAILALRQNLTAKIHEHDNTNVYKKFKDLEGEIYTAEVHHIRHKAIILLDDEGNEIIMPKDGSCESTPPELSIQKILAPTIGTSLLSINSKTFPFKSCEKVKFDRNKNNIINLIYSKIN